MEIDFRTAALLSSDSVKTLFCSVWEDYEKEYMMVCHLVDGKRRRPGYRYGIISRSVYDEYYDVLLKANTAAQEYYQLGSALGDLYRAACEREEEEEKTRPKIQFLPPDFDTMVSEIEETFRARLDSEIPLSEEERDMVRDLRVQFRHLTGSCSRIFGSLEDLLYPTSENQGT